MGVSFTLAPWATDLMLLVFLAMAVMIGIYANREQQPNRLWFGLAFMALLLIVLFGHTEWHAN